MNAIPKIAPILKITQEELERENLETYLHIRLKRCESELFNLKSLPDTRAPDASAPR
jgi:hypothetical protein